MSNAGKGAGGVVWDASYVLAHYLVTAHLNELKNSRVIELGAGAGLVSLACALNGAKVTATDGNTEVLGNLYDNLHSNLSVVQSQKQNDHEIKAEDVCVREFKWSKDTSPLTQPNTVFIPNKNPNNSDNPDNDNKSQIETEENVKIAQAGRYIYI